MLIMGTMMAHLQHPWITKPLPDFSRHLCNPTSLSNHGSIPTPVRPAQMGYLVAGAEHGHIGGLCVESQFARYTHDPDLDHDHDPDHNLDPDLDLDLDPDPDHAHDPDPALRWRFFLVYIEATPSPDPKTQ